MKNDLYTFKKDVWFVKLINWVYNIDSVNQFKTFCPLFWLLVVTILTLPLILIIKMFGKTGTSVLNSLESYRRRKRYENEKAFVQKCSKEGLTDKECYDIFKSSCWDDYNYSLDYDRYCYIIDGYDTYKKYLEELKTVKQEKVRQVKESKWFTYSSLIVSVAVIGLILYCTYLIFSLIELKPVDWDMVILFTNSFLGATLATIIVIGFFKYIWIPFIQYMKCRKCIICKLGIWEYLGMPFTFLWRGIVIVADMIYMTYKQACPMIKWTDDK